MLLHRLVSALANDRFLSDFTLIIFLVYNKFIFINEVAMQSLAPNNYELSYFNRLPSEVFGEITNKLEFSELRVLSSVSKNLYIKAPQIKINWLNANKGNLDSINPDYLPQFKIFLKAHVKDLQSLDLRKQYLRISEVADILTDCPKLNSLGVLLYKWNFISPIHIISKLQNLRDLKFKFDSLVEEIPSLERLEKLTSLEIDAIGIKKLSFDLENNALDCNVRKPLDKLTDLRKLVLQLQELEEMSSLPFPGLQSFELSSLKVSKLPALNLLTRLIDLKLNLPCLVELPLISNLGKLQNFVLESKFLTELPSFDDLKNLNSLKIICASVEKISKLSSLNKLNKLVLILDKVKMVPHLDELIKLQFFYLKAPLVTKMPRLNNCLKRLFVSCKDLDFDPQPQISNHPTLKKIQIYSKNFNIDHLVIKKTRATISSEKDFKSALKLLKDFN